jgi:CrcB protein
MLVRAAGAGFPYWTLFVNVVGSLVIGLVAASRVSSTELRTFLITGVCGGFTTYSAFNEETLTAWRSGARVIAAGNVLATLVLCAAAGLLGAALARSFR